MEQKYYVTIDNENVAECLDNMNLFDIKSKVEIFWSGTSTFDYAEAKFEEAISLISNQYYKLKTLKKWRVIRLFDSNGKFLRGEH